MTSSITFGDEAHDAFVRTIQTGIPEGYTVAVMKPGAKFVEAGPFLAGQDFRYVAATNEGLVVLDISEDGEPSSNTERVIPWLDVERIHIY